MTPEQVIDVWYETKNKERFKAFLKECGFTCIGYGDRSIVLSKKCIDFVVKVSSNGIVTRKFKRPDLEKFRLPYLYVNGNRNIAIQQKVTRRTKASRYRAWSHIRDNVDANLGDFDIHQGNVGWFKGKPVFFDYI